MMHNNNIIIYVREFAQYEELDPRSDHPVRSVHLFGIETQILRNGVMVQVVRQSGSDPAKANHGKDRQEKIPARQCRPPAPGIPLGKIGLSDPDHDPVS